MVFTQDLSDFQALTDAHHSVITEGFQALKQQYHDHPFPFCSVLRDDDLYQKAQQYADRIRHEKKIKYLILLGTGGSSLGARAIADWCGHFMPLPHQEDYCHFIILDNFDSITWHDVLSKLNIEESHFLLISKSGKTLETLSQAYLLEEYFKKYTVSLRAHCTIITEYTDNPLYRFAQRHDVTCFEHHPDIGGRYSVMSITGILPILLLGYDITPLRKGALNILGQFEQAQEYKAFISTHAAAGFALMELEKNIKAHIAFMYGDRFSSFGLWLRQLYAESLGKNKKGMLFVPSIGPLEQHSQLQLYADGCPDKVFTFYMTEHTSPVSYFNAIEESEFQYLKGKSTIDVKNALQFGTLDSLRHLGYAIRTITISDFYLENLGALMMHAMLETVMMAQIMKIDPFDQPAVEDSKRRTKEYMHSL